MILKDINPQYSLEEPLLKLNFHYSGHLMPRADALQKILMLGKSEGKRRGGETEVKIVIITNSIDMNLSKLQEIVEDRGISYATVHGVAELDTT